MSISAMKQALEVLSVHPEHGGNAFTRAADELRKAIDEQEKRHLCPEWDFMEITVDDQEFDSCLCFPRESKPSLWLAIAKDGRVKYTTDSGRASEWKKSGSYRLVRDYYTAPVIAEAEKQEPAEIGNEWKPCVKLPIVVHVREQRKGETHVSTREGITPVKEDDLIMRGVAGEEYPIGRELFNRTYTFDTAPVHAIDISQERVDETAKREHDLVGACVTCGAPHGFWLSAPPTDVISPSVIKAISKREWVGLATEEARKFYESDLSREELIHKIDEFLEEKNT